MKIITSFTGERMQEFIDHIDPKKLAAKLFEVALVALVTGLVHKGLNKKL